MREYCTVRLVFVDSAQVLAQHPHGWIEPLEGGEKVNEEHIIRVSETDVSAFMCEYGIILCLVVAAIHHDIAHPTEWSHLGVTGHTESDAIIQWMLFAMFNE